MSGVLVLSRLIVNQLDTIPCRARREVLGRYPAVAPRVGNLLHNRVLRDRVARGAFEQNESDRGVGGGLPGDVVRGADRDDAGEAWGEDGVADGRVACWRGVGGCE